jgi:hypothetical protein
MVSSSLLQVVSSSFFLGGLFLLISMLERVNYRIFLVVIFELVGSSRFPGGQFHPFSKLVCLVNFPGGLLQPFSNWSALAIFQVASSSHFLGAQFQPFSKWSVPPIF